MELFSLLDTGGEGELDLSEFMQGMSQLKGVAKNKDMVMLTKGIERLGKGIIRMGEGMGLSGLKDEHEEGGEGKLKERVGNLRSKVRERLQKSEDEMLRLSSRMDRMLKQTEAAIRRIKTGQPAGSGQADAKDDLAKSRSRRRDGEKKAGRAEEKDSKELKELKDRKEPREKREKREHKEPREHRDREHHKERRERGKKRGEEEDADEADA